MSDIVPRYNILQVVEDVLAKHLIAQSIPELTPADGRPHVYRGIENLETAENEGEDSSIKRVPWALVSCESADPVLSYSPGSWDANCYVEIESSGDDFDHSGHSALVEKVLQWVIISDLLTYLQKIDPNFSFQKLIVGRLSYSIAGRNWATRQEFILREANGNSIPDTTPPYSVAPPDPGFGSDRGPVPGADPARAN